MTTIRANLSVSMDGYSTGPNPSPQDPLGRDGERLHEWQFPASGQAPLDADAEIGAEFTQGVGAFVMGRRMFDNREGPLDESWRGWWGENPPFHGPVFVVSHHPRDSAPMAGGTTYHFVDGVDRALRRAREAAGDKDVMIAGGAGVIHQVLLAGELDELDLHIAPFTLGSGLRLFDDVGEQRFEPIRTIGTPAATHVRYRVLR